MNNRNSLWKKCVVWPKPVKQRLSVDEVRDCSFFLLNAKWSKANTWCFVKMQKAFVSQVSLNDWCQMSLCPLYSDSDLKDFYCHYSLFFPKNIWFPESTLMSGLQVSLNDSLFYSHFSSVQQQALYLNKAVIKPTSAMQQKQSDAVCWWSRTLRSCKWRQAGMSDEAMHSTDRENRKDTQSNSTTWQTWCNKSTIPNSAWVNVIDRCTVPGARGGKASVEPAPAAASSSSSSSRFSSSPGARIFLTEWHGKFDHLQIRCNLLLKLWKASERTSGWDYFVTPKQNILEKYKFKSEFLKRGYLP